MYLSIGESLEMYLHDSQIIANADDVRDDLCKYSKSSSNHCIGHFRTKNQNV